MEMLYGFTIYDYYNVNKQLIESVQVLEETKQNLFNSCSKLHDENTTLKNKIEKLNDELEEVKIENDYWLKVNGEITQKNDDLLIENYVLKDELSILSSNITFNHDWKSKEQHELEQATLLVDNLLEQLAKAEKEVLTLSNDKKKLQLLNERMNNCINLQSQEIFKLLK